MITNTIPENSMTKKSLNKSKKVECRMTPEKLRNTSINTTLTPITNDAFVVKSTIEVGLT
jgi:hypothetical protein